jgi:hypothetical protein
LCNISESNEDHGDNSDVATTDIHTLADNITITDVSITGTDVIIYYGVTCSYRHDNYHDDHDVFEGLIRQYNNMLKASTI